MTDMDTVTVLTILGIILLIIIFVLCSEKGKYGYSKNAQRYRRYYRSFNKNLHNLVKEKFLTSSDKDFDQFCESIKKRINRKYSVNYRRIYDTRMKRAVLDVVNQNTHKITAERIRKVEGFFPLLHRAYFGPKVTKQIYSQAYQERKFHFRLQSEEKTPEIRNIIDLALYFNTSVSILLGYCYTQALNLPSYFIKSKKPRRKEFKSRHYKHYFISKRKLSKEYSNQTNDTLKLEREGIEEIPRENPSNPSIEIEYPKKSGVSTTTRENFSPHKTHWEKITQYEQKRLISVPRYPLKKMQQKILLEILEKAEIKPYCTGFRPTGSTIKNAQPHLKAKTLVKMDLHNFFPSLKIYHVFQVFRGFGYSRPVAGALACLCTDFYNSDVRFMPQGAPTSPMIGNLYGSILDARLNALWKKGGFNYTRYADDLTYSSGNPKARVDGLIKTTYKIIKDEKLKPNYKKTKIFRSGHRKEVTGIIVNDHLNINKKWVKRFRAELHHYLLDGLPLGEEGWHIAQQLQGKLSYLFMVNPIKAQKYLPQVKQIFQNFAEALKTKKK